MISTSFEKVKPAPVLAILKRVTFDFAFLNFEMHFKMVVNGF